MQTGRRLKIAIIIPSKKYTCLGSFLWTQRYGPLQVASVIHDAGYQVKVFNEEIGTKVSPQHIASNYDVVGFSCKTSAITRAEELVKRIKSAASDRERYIITVLGGEHASMSEGTRISRDFDYVLRGESEDAFITILKSLEFENQKKLFILPKKSFYQCESFNNTPYLSLVEEYDDTVNSFLFKRLKAIWVLKNKKAPTLTFQRTRGCPYACSFCPTEKYLQGRSYRRRSLESAIAYLHEHISKSGITKVVFEDPTAAIPHDKNAHDFFEAIAKSSLKIEATVLVRVDLCNDEKLLEKMRAAGVANLSIGIESLAEKTRLMFNKNTSYDTIERSIEIFHRYGFSLTGLFIVGNDTDDIDGLEKIKTFIVNNGIEKWRVSPICQMPELENQFMPAHRFFMWNELNGFGKDLADYTNGEFVYFFPRNITPSTLQEQIKEFNNSCSSLKGCLKLLLKHKQFDSVFQRLGNNFAQKVVQKEILNSGYIEMLKEIEKSFYYKKSNKVILIENKLVDRFRLSKQKIIASTEISIC